MGGERRGDTSHDVRPKGKRDDGDADREDEEQFDTAHAHRQVEARAWREWPETVGPDSYVLGVGDQDELFDKFEAAIAAHKGDQLLAMIADMSRERRAGAWTQHASDLAPLLGGGEVLRAADMCQAALDSTLDAALLAKPPPPLHTMRAYLADIHPRELAWALLAPARLAAVRKAYPGPASELVPQITDAVAFEVPGLIRWHLESTPAATVAREMLSAPSRDEVFKRLGAIVQLGRMAWLWVFHIDDHMAAAALPEVLATYRYYAKDTDVQEFLAKKEAVRAQAKPEAIAKEVAADRRELTKTGTVDEIASSAQAAGMSLDQQLEWLLDKPGVTTAEFRLAAATWTTDTTGFTASTLARVHKKFPDTTPADVFGVVPDAMYRLAIKTPALRSWFVDTAEPIEVLRFVAFDPDHIADLCKWLVAHGTGYQWVYALGGGRDDHLLRRFVLKCPDPHVVAYLRDRVIADQTKPGGTELTSAPIDASAYEGSNAAFDDTLATKAHGKQLATTVDNLSDDEVNELRHDTVKVKEVLERSDPDYAMRVIDRVQPRLRDVLNFAPAGALKGLAGWIAARPEDQVIEGLAHHVAAVRARKLLPALGPLELFPQLESGPVLAQVLLRNPDLIEWIVDTSEPIAVLTVLGSGAVAMVAVQALSKCPHRINALPPGKMLPKPAHDGLARLAQYAKGALHDALADKLNEKPESADDAESPQENAQILKDTDGKELVASLEVAFEGEPTSEVILRICRRHAADAAGLMKHDKLVAKVRDKLPVSPRLAFPGAPLAAFMATPAGRAWAFDTIASFEILRACGSEPGVLDQVAAALDRNEDGAFLWVRAIPRGHALHAIEKNVLHALALRVTTVEARTRLFVARFDTNMSASFDAKELDRIWNVLERVPESHVSQGSIEQFRETQGGPTFAGEFDPDNKQVQLAGQLMGREGFGEYDRTDATATMSRDEAKKSLGLDDAMFDKWVKEGRIVAYESGFRLARQDDHDALTTTLLHEVGHSVDDMLGNHSELVFELAGWRAHTEADFDQWATDLGGWSSVAPDDQRQIREVWLMWLSSSRGDEARESVGDMVAHDHPAVAKKYEHVGVVQLARNKELASRGHPAVIGDRVAFVSHKQQRWYTMKLDGLRAAPSDYSLTAPGEYFAECYANYYKDYDGTPATAEKKGVSLAPWIKNWFDKNIDTLQQNPNKLR